MNGWIKIVGFVLIAGTAVVGGYNLLFGPMPPGTPFISGMVIGLIALNLFGDEIV